MQYFRGASDRGWPSFSTIEGIASPSSIAVYLTAKLLHLPWMLLDTRRYSCNATFGPSHRSRAPSGWCGRNGLGSTCSLPMLVILTGVQSTTSTAVLLPSTMCPPSLIWAVQIPVSRASCLAPRLRRTTCATTRGCRAAKSL
jgi:hypothetical protein